MPVTRGRALYLSLSTAMRESSPTHTMSMPSVPLQSIRSMAAWGPSDRAFRSVKRALFSLPNIFRKSLPVPVGTLVTAAFSYPAAPFTASLRVPSPPQA